MLRSPLFSQVVSQTTDSLSPTGWFCVWCGNVNVADACGCRAFGYQLSDSTRTVLWFHARANTRSRENWQGR